MKPQQSVDDALPKVIFLDAMGTLFGIKGSVGEIYRAIAINYGVEISASQIEEAFIASFKTAPPLAFTKSIYNYQDIDQQEFNWWKKVVKQTFDRIENISNFTDFSVFFAELYAYFATEKPWYIYSDVIPSLCRWQQQGIQLGIISNFDSRLYGVLESLKSYYIKQYINTSLSQTN